MPSAFISDYESEDVEVEQEENENKHDNQVEPIAMMRFYKKHPPIRRVRKA